MRDAGVDEMMRRDVLDHRSDKDMGRLYAVLTLRLLGEAVEAPYREVKRRFLTQNLPSMRA